MEELLGANWRTTLIGGIKQILSALIIGSLTFPSDWSNKTEVVRFIATIIAAMLGIQFAKLVKDKQVTGGSVQQTLDGEPAKPGTQTLVDITKESPPKK